MFQRKWLLSFRDAGCQRLTVFHKTDRKIDPSSKFNISKRMQLLSLKLLRYSKDHDLCLMTQFEIKIPCCIMKFKENSDKSSRKAYESELFWGFSSLAPPSSTYGQNIISKEFNQLVGFLRQVWKLNSTQNHLSSYKRIFSVIRYISFGLRCLKIIDQLNLGWKLNIDFVLNWN